MTDVTPWLSGWQRVMLQPGDIATFTRGEFTVHLIGTHDIRLTGPGTDKTLRFYAAATTVMEAETR